VQDRFIIDKSGNVGIGTTSPGAQFHTTSSALLAGSTWIAANKIYVNGDDFTLGQMII
jgi:hypothetical protein